MEAQNLKQALAQGDASVRALIRGPSGAPLAREQQEERAALALSIMQENADIQKPHRAVIMREARSAMEDLHTGITKELRSKADANLQTLQSRIDNTRLKIVDQEKKESTMLEGAAVEARELVRDVSRGDAKAIATVAVPGVIGGYLIYKLWKKGAGYFRNAMAVLAGGVAAAAGAIGLSAFSRTIGSYARSLGIDPGAAIDTAVQKAKVAGSGFAEGAQEVAESLDKRVLEKLRNGEYVAAVIGGAWYLFDAAGNLVLDKFPKALSVFVGNWDGAFKAHCAGMTVYGASFGVVQGIIAGVQNGSLKAGISTAAYKSLMWELECVSGGKTLYNATFSPDARLTWKTFAGSADEAHLTNLANNWKYAQSQLKAQRSTGNEAGWLRQMGRRESQIQTTLIRMQRQFGTAGIHPRIEQLFGQEVAHQVLEATKKGHRPWIPMMDRRSTIGALEKVLPSFFEKSAATPSLSTSAPVAPATSVAPGAAPAAVAARPGAAPAAVPGRPAAAPAAISGGVDDALKQASATVDDVLVAAEKAGDISKPAADAVRKSAGARKMFDAALKSGANRTAEVGRVLRAAAAANALRVLTAGTIALDVFAVYMAYCDYQAYGEQARNTDNPELRALHENSQTVAIVEGGVSFVGLSITGCVIGKAIGSTSSIVAFAASPYVSGPLLPIGIATALGVVTYKEFNDAAKDRARTWQDWESYDPAALYTQITKYRAGGSRRVGHITQYEGTLSPSKRGPDWEYDQFAKETEVHQDIRIQQAGAYIANSFWPLTEEQRKDPAIVAARAERVTFALMYLAINQRGNITPSTLRDAADYAELRQEARKEKAANGNRQITQTKPDGTVRAFRLADAADVTLGLDDASRKEREAKGQPEAYAMMLAWRERKRADTVTEIRSLRGLAASPASAPVAQQAVQALLLREARPWLDAMEAKIAISDHSAEEKDKIRYVTMSWLRQRLSTNADALLAKDPLDAKALEQAIDSVKEKIMRDTDSPTDPNAPWNIGKFGAILAEFSPDAEKDLPYAKLKGTSQVGAALSTQWLGGNLDVPGKKPNPAEAPGITYLTAELGPQLPGGYWEMPTGWGSLNRNPRFAFVQNQWMVRWDDSSEWKDPSEVRPPWGRGADRARKILAELTRLNATKG
jgi:hypothetical protein